MNIKATPWMADIEIEIMDSLFKTQRPKRVLEWGAGGSTLYWPPKYKFIEKWLAVERDRAFAKELRAQVADKVTVKGATGKRYWKQKGQFDMIIVDGHHRPECLEAALGPLAQGQRALGLLAEGGIVVLHDSGRPAYNVAWKLYPFAETLYAGEKPVEGGYKHRGITVFWQDEAVETGGWCREYVVEADLPERPSYVVPKAAANRHDHGELLAGAEIGTPDWIEQGGHTFTLSPEGAANDHDHTGLDGYKHALSALVVEEVTVPEMEAEVEARSEYIEGFNVEEFEAELAAAESPF